MAAWRTRHQRVAGNGSHRDARTLTAIPGPIAWRTIHRARRECAADVTTTRCRQPRRHATRAIVADSDSVLNVRRRRRSIAVGGTPSPSSACRSSWSRSGSRTPCARSAAAPLSSRSRVITTAGATPVRNTSAASSARSAIEPASTTIASARGGSGSLTTRKRPA